MVFDKKAYNNSEEQKQKRRDYMKAKRDEEKLNNNKIICYCGGKYSTNRAKYLHIKSKKHLSYEVEIKEPIEDESEKALLKEIEKFKDEIIIMTNNIKEKLEIK